MTVKIRVVPYGVIYVVENKLNGKKYVCKTVNFRRRMNEYRHRKPNRKSYMYGIVKIIDDVGYDNFDFYIIDTAYNDLDLSNKEAYHIAQMKTTDPQYGYNSRIGDLKSSLNESTKELMRQSHIGLRETGDTKRKKSKRVIAFKGDECIIADSAKLFGDHIGKKKDVIGFAARNGTKIGGYRVFQLDCDIDRTEKFEKLKDKSHMEFYKLVKGSVQTIQSLYDIKYLSYE